MPIQKLYDYAIDFVEGTMLSKLAKVYPLSSGKKLSWHVDQWETQKEIYPTIY